MNFRVIVLCGALSAASLPAADALTEQFQKALFEEEANRNLDAAIAGYEAVIKRLDEQRELAATAVFRLGESFRKLGKTNEAVRAYERIIREFADQVTLVKLSGQNLSVLRPAPPPDASGRNAFRKRLQELVESGGENNSGQDWPDEAIQYSSITVERQALRVFLEAIKGLSPGSDAELAVIMASQPSARLSAELTQVDQARRSLNEFQSQFGNDHPAVRTSRSNLLLLEESVHKQRDAIVTAAEARLAALDRLAGAEALLQDSSARIQLDPAARARQKELLEQEIALVEGQLKEVRQQVEVGVVATSEPIGKQRELIHLQRQVAALDDSPDSIRRQRQLIDQELGLVRQLVDEAKRRIDNGKATRNDLVELERQMLQLMREDLDLTARPEQRTAAASAGPTMTAEEAEELRRVQALAANSPDLLNRPSGEPSNFPLMWAARNGWVQVVDLLLRHGARTDILHEYRSPLSQAAEAGHLAVVDRLIRAGADLNGPGGGSPTALWNAAQLGYATIAATLLKAGANPDLPRDQNRRVNNSTQKGQLPVEGPLAVANLEISRLLLDHGASSDGVPGSTPPIVAAGADTEKLELLLAHNAKPGVANQHGETALHYAAKAGNAANVRRLLALGLDPNARTVAGYTAMHFAATENHPELIRLLAEHGAEVNALDPSGDTPLHFAAMRHTLDVARALVEAGADPEQKNKRGNPSRDYVWPFADAGAPYVWRAGAPLPHTRQPVYEVGYAREPGGPRFLSTYQPFMELLGGSTNTWLGPMRSALPALPAADLERTSDR